MVDRKRNEKERVKNLNMSKKEWLRQIRKHEIDIKTNLKELIKHISQDTDCFLSEIKIGDGFDLIISIPYLESKIEKLAYKLHRKEFEELNR